MTTKQEYIESLERMKVSYYNLDGCMSAMNKFKEDINLLAGLVNEHFEEKQETNFEHYNDVILDCCIDHLALVKGIPKSCSKTDCNVCDFLTIQKNCSEIAKEWLKQPYKKMTYKLTKFEFDLIKTYRNCHESCKLSEFKQLIELKDKGYFKDINLDLTIHKILDNCEVVG